MNLIKYKKILIIAAHPDDEVLGCGGFLAKYKSLINSTILFAGEGSSCRYQLNKNKERVKEDIKIREKSAKSAAKYFGINKIIFNDLPCGRFDTIPIIDINKMIEKYINEIKPDIIFVHDPGDVNNDHKIVYRSTIMATRPNSTCKVNTIITYEVPSSTECSFETKDTFSPNIFIELTKDHINNKWMALNEYMTEVSEFPFPRSEEGLVTFAKYRGMQVGYEYAEAFKLIRTIIN
tara:strand:+ start:79 stop:783 length:705 start_codon:yes stop_codon:yes gene_type:complete